ncbi:MAG: type VI secretion protein IcmF/TssM N-terminal domain-containing protein, partial [Planctomycetota bacterium]|nr:type VI secretion protein IcmF/TssM N-terminal domain-containing protein [Planctomycetota bacterium]
MRYVPRRFVHLPTPLRMVLLLAGGGGLAYLLYVFLPARLHWTLILLAGVLVVGLVLMLFGALVQWGRKRKAKPLEQGLAENVARTPQGVSKAAKRAQLDDLRRKFMEGIETFRAAGKNLGEIPWYLVVGEPGSGKTEAIRHCRVGFPPGLHKELQGAGGTINMDWWFTDHAVILDTAGRLLFEDVAAGSTSEWQECLRLLATHRANCPINGLLLAIPADSLITDTAEQIEHKAGRLAAQLDVIQRTLGIRFPAFIVVTKCDLINGFREFFENLDDPDLQNQMVGWSNPADLDEPFDPSRVDQHLATVVERLKQRRYGLLLDPVPVGDASARRIDQIDALYAFPDSLQRVLPRLRQYLQMIFVGGQWSAKPLFLRGIYFTSAMREGSALDAELADALGVPVEQLPDGRVWQRDRSYFLRDVFTEKAFREWGLVTRAERAKRQYTRRKAVVLGAGILAVALLALFTVYGWLTFRSALGERSEYFRAAAPLPPRQAAREAGAWEPDPRSGQGLFLPVVCHEARTTWSSFYYQDAGVIDVGGKSITPAGFHVGLKAVNEQPIQVPAVFRVAAIGRDLAKDCRRAQRVLFEQSVLWPVLLAVREQMAATPPENWGPADADDTAAPSPPA